MNPEFQFLEDIKKIFYDTYVSCYQENKKRKTISFDVGRNSISFDRLEKLSKLLKTKYINFSGDKETYHLSEVTTDTEHSGELFIYDVKF